MSVASQRVPEGSEIEASVLSAGQPLTVQLDVVAYLGLIGVVVGGELAIPASPALSAK